MKRPAARRPERGPVGVKRLKGIRKPMSARVVGTGPRNQDRSRAKQARMTPLLKRLKSEVGEMRDQGNVLSKQMWLLYNTFEDFVKVKQSEHVRRMKKTKKAANDSDHEWLKTTGISVRKSHDEEADESIEQARSDAPERELELTVTRIPICEMDPVIMSDLEDSAAGEPSADATSYRRSPEKRTKGRFSIGDNNHRSSKKAKRSSSGKQNIIVDKVVPLDVNSDLDKSIELFPWPLSVEHKKALEASGLSVVRDSLHASSPSEAESSLDTSSGTSQGETSPAESTGTVVIHSKPTSPIISSGYESEIKEEEIDDMFYGSPGMRPPKRNMKTNRTNKPAGDADQQPIYENVEFVETCSRASAESMRVDNSGVAEPQSAGSMDATMQSVVSDSSLANIDNKGLNMINFGAALGFMFPDPRTPHGTSLLSSTQGSSSRLQRSQSADNLSFERDEFMRCSRSPVYENLPRSLRGQVSPPRRFTMRLAEDLQSVTLPKPQPKHSSTPFRIDLDNLTIQDITIGAKDESTIVVDDSRLDLTLGVTPRQSAFRPYVADNPQPIFTACLRTQNISPSYICMSRRDRREATKCVSKKLMFTPSKTPARALDLTESGYASSKMLARRFQGLEPELTYDRAAPSVDSGRGGSVSPADDSNGPVKMASVLSDQTIDLTTVTEPNEEDPIYESIADCGLYSRVGDILPDISISLCEHTYDRIDDITASTLVESPQAPEPPPARTSTANLPSASLTSDTSQNTLKIDMTQTYSKPTDEDVIDQNRYHKYTVNDVLESVERLAGHLPAAKNRSNIYSLISDRRTRQKFSKTLAREKPAPKGPLRADHSQVMHKERRASSPQPFDRWCNDSNKENDIQAMAINRLPRYASIRKTTSFVDLSPKTRVVAPRDTQSLSRAGKENVGCDATQKPRAGTSRPQSATMRTKVLTQSNNHYQNLHEFSSGFSKRTRPSSEVLEPQQQGTFRRTRSALHLQWKNGTLNEIWC